MTSREFSEDIVYYPRCKGVLVTDTWFCAHGRAYAINDLAKVTWRPGPAQAARWVALEIIVVETVLVGVAVLAAGASALAFACGALYLVLAAAGVLFSFHRWPTPLVLHGDYRGTATVLFSSTDHIEFHKVVRALRRSDEGRRELVA